MKKIFLFSIAILITSYSLHSQCTDCYQTVNIGQYSSAIGKLTKSMGLTSFASGFGSEAQGFYTTSMGFYSFAIGSKDIAIGSAVRASGGKSIVIGAGEWNAKVFLNNPIPRSLMIGFFSQYPTLFVSDSPLSAFFDRTGRVGIGNITNPQAKLHLLADEGEEATIFIQPHNWERESATLKLGSDSSFISANRHRGMEFISERDFLFNSGFVGINTDRPRYNLHVNGNTFTVALTLFNAEEPPNDGDILYTNAQGSAYWGTPPIGGGGSSLWEENEMAYIIMMAG
jgi:hypothetical protein